MDQVRLLDFLLMVLATGGGWLLKSLWDATAALRKDLGDLEKNLPREYVRKVDWDRATDAVTESIRDMREEMTKRLDDIWHELKGKRDK